MDKLIQKMNVARSVQQNIPYGYGILRSGDIRMSTPVHVPISHVAPAPVGGFDPTPILETINNPLVQKALKKPIDALILNPLDKLWDWLGMGTYRIGGSWNKPGDIGMLVPPHYNQTKAAFGRGMTKKDIKNIRVLEHRLMPLIHDKNAFIKKLLKIRAAGGAYFKKHRKLIKKGCGKMKVTVVSPTKYKLSELYKVKKAKHYTKFPKAEHGKYRKHPRYKIHKSKYQKKQA